MTLAPFRESANRHLWYDSLWLTNFESARSLIAARYPEKLTQFLHATAPLRTRHDFRVIEISDVFDQTTREKIKETVAGIGFENFNVSEVGSFGRFILHNHPYFSELQGSLVDRVSKAVGESVEAGYNFLSLYSNLGVCGIHMDAPEAKWTLDYCIDQSQEWPICFSQVVPWPRPTADGGNIGWWNQIRNDRKLSFTSHSLRPGNAVIFSGSSQWHYRDPIPQLTPNAYCNLLFFHFIPAGTKDLIDQSKWPQLFGLAELREVIWTPRQPG